MTTIIIKFRLSVPRNKKDISCTCHTSTRGCQDALLIRVSQGPRLIKTPSKYISTIAETGKRKLKPESAMKLSSLEVRKWYFSSQLISRNMSWGRIQPQEDQEIHSFTCPHGSENSISWNDTKDYHRTHVNTQERKRSINSKKVS